MRGSLVSYQMRLVAGLAAGLAVALSGAGCTRVASEPSATLAPSVGAVAIINGAEVPAPAIPMGSPATIKRILDEGKNRNQVMDHLHHLSVEIGPRLTGSTRLEEANRWSAAQFESWGLSNVRLDQWGEISVRFDRGASTGKVISLTRPRSTERDRVEESVLREVQLSALSWSAGTQGAVRGPVVRMPDTDEEFEEVKEKLKGAWVLLKPPAPGGRRGLRVIGASMNDRATVRYAIQTGRSLESLGVAERDRAAMETLIPEYRRLMEAGVLGFISSSRDERVWTTSVRGWRTMDANELPRDVEVCVRLSDYDCINSRLADGDEFVVEFDLQHTFVPGPIPVYNTIAEIPGTERPDEYVIMSAHLDSWDGPGSQGTTDNGTGCAVMMEAARILMASGAKPKRTIKFILWTGEEQGLLGSREWVKRNEALWPRISACFVDDGGTNSQGGLKGTASMAPMLAAATAPVNGQFFDAVTGAPLNVNVQGEGDRIPRTGGSDHVPFNERGIPGFFWDEVGRAEYGYGWHTQHDRIDLAVPEYLMQSSTCSAITAYNLACAPELLPRAAPPAATEAEQGERPRRE